MRVPDAASCAGVLWLKDKIGRACGASTGTNIYAAVKLASEAARNGPQASIVTLICDGGERYAETCFDEGWRCAQGLNLETYRAELKSLAG
jgi:cysteine synthase A